MYERTTIKAKPPSSHENNLRIQFIKFTNWNDRLSIETISHTRKAEYEALIENITNRGCSVERVISAVQAEKQPLTFRELKS